MSKSSFRSVTLPTVHQKRQRSLRTCIYSESLDFARKIQDTVNDTEKLTAEKLIAYAALSGMSLADLDRLPLPMVLSAVYEYIRLRYGSEGETKAATQTDYDNF